jgi:hypothetical protein
MSLRRRNGAVKKTTEDLVKLAELVRARNKVTDEIAALIGRPAQIGHVGEYIAAQIFQIRLLESASHKAIDGHFQGGQLDGRSVDVKWFTLNDGILDLREDAPPDFYLVLTGPRTAAGSSRGTTRPWVIEAVYLFEGRPLVEELQRRGVRRGVATSVRQHLWREAEIYPEARNRQFRLTEEQRRLLRLFQ